MLKSYEFSLQNCNIVEVEKFILWMLPKGFILTDIFKFLEITVDMQSTSVPSEF